VRLRGAAIHRLEFSGSLVGAADSRALYSSLSIAAIELVGARSRTVRAERAH